MRCKSVLCGLVAGGNNCLRPTTSPENQNSDRPLLEADNAECLSSRSCCSIAPSLLVTSGSHPPWNRSRSCVVPDPTITEAVSEHANPSKQKRKIGGIQIVQTYNIAPDNNVHQTNWQTKLPLPIAKTKSQPYDGACETI